MDKTSIQEAKSEAGRTLANSRWVKPEWQDKERRSEFGKARAADRWGKTKKARKTRAKKAV